jgi:hypothetical protein
VNKYKRSVVDRKGACVSYPQLRIAHHVLQNFLGQSGWQHCSLIPSCSYIVKGIGRLNAITPFTWDADVLQDGLGHFLRDIAFPQLSEATQVCYCSFTSARTVLTRDELNIGPSEAS